MKLPASYKQEPAPIKRGLRDGHLHLFAVTAAVVPIVINVMADAQLIS